MLNFKEYSTMNEILLIEGKYDGMKLHMFIVENGDLVDAVYSDEKDEKSALSKVKEWLLKSKMKGGKLTYIGMTTPRKKEGVFV